MPRLVAALLLAVALPLQALAQTKTPADAERDVQAALARPVSPGSVALLLPHAALADVVQRLIQAIDDPRPEVRAVAARVWFHDSSRRAGRGLGLGLGEGDQRRGSLGTSQGARPDQGAASDARIANRLGRFDSRTTEAWLATVSRTRPGDVWGQLAHIHLGGDAVGQALVDLRARAARCGRGGFRPVAADAVHGSG